MLYLATQFVWFLIAAAALGLAMGWISHDGGRLRLAGPLVLVLAAVWAAGGVLSWTQTLNGVAALWVESALLFAAVYALGCTLGSLARGRGARDPDASEGRMAGPGEV